METVGIAEIKRDISTIVNRVAFGRERIILTSRGKPKAAVVSIEDLQRLTMLVNDNFSPPPRSEKSGLGYGPGCAGNDPCPSWWGSLFRCRRRCAQVERGERP